MTDLTRAQRREWRDRVFGHPELSLASKLVLLALETFADYPSGANARPGVAGLMEKCGGLSDRAVRTALTDGKRIGLIERTRRANPKRGLAAVYRLVSTGTGVPVDDVSTGTSAPVDDHSSGTVVPIESRFQPARKAFQPAQPPVSTGTPVPPTKSLTPIQNTNRRARQVRNARATDWLPDLITPGRCGIDEIDDLTGCAQRLLDEGETDLRTLRVAVRLWNERRDAGVGLLRCLLADAAKQGAQ